MFNVETITRFGVILITGALIGCASENSSTPPAPLSAATIHERALVVDTHADIEIPERPSRYAGEDGRSKVAPDKMQAGGVDAVVMAVAVGPGPRDADGYAQAQALAAEKLAAVRALVADSDNNTVLVLTADELEQAHARGQSALILGFQNARILGTDVEALDTWYAEGVRVFALTHMGHNDFADSSRPLFIGATGAYEANEEHGGLSPLGRAAIERIDRLGGIIDVSQLSRAATLQVLEMSSRPVIASHSNVQALSDVRRNLSDEEIDRIGENGGVIHIAAFKGYLFDSNDTELDARLRAVRRAAGIAEDYDYPFELYWEIDDPQVQQTFVTAVSDLLGPGSVEDMLNHIDYVVRRIGVEHVGIGNDFNHGSGIAGFNDASEALNITKGLVRRGYSPEDINKIWGDNFLRVFRQAVPAD
ncbi:MAG: membrane dipeptidase [Pseudomonadota bacterium]